ncbi:N-6 DNA methylase [Streptomyces sp. ME02-7008A-1]|uniref:N-6 DNA methylase n=1 Tax=unclassified Streptomyces TaxID=2593676 RepID=UPI0029A900DE|nr:MULTISPECIES: N-6 DNA methylase [unclassified Streptomyces]MDX3180195.1 N-6 DNA methylase [Streptomyces sp. ME02-7008A-1]MDX3300936.1 N-6 DNA methylase [Streptomyces sp. ME02-7008A]
MPQPPAQVTAAEISRIAGVTRATVSNWRRRHDDFPAPSGGTDSSPLYDLVDVQKWLGARGHASTADPAEELRTTLRLHPGGGGTTGALLPLALATARRTPEELSTLAGLSDAELVARADRAVADLAELVPGAEAVHFAAHDVDVLRALLRCVQDDASGEAALAVLAERELEDSAASGTYRTPVQLADLVARLAPGPYAQVLDPACGSGSLLSAAARRGATVLYGQDSVTVQAQRSAVSLLLAAPEADITVRAGDSLRADAFGGVTVDAVLCNPPYGDRDWGHDELAYDARWAYGVPPRAESELAWVQHALSHLVPGGHAVLLLPPATASRASGRRVRMELVRSGALRAVVALPPGAAAPFHVGLQIWVLRRPEPAGPAHTSVLFVDTSEAAGAGADTATGTGTRTGSTASGTRTGRTPLNWTALTETALTQWSAFAKDPDAYADEPGTARAVPVVDLLDDVVDLSPARHVRASRTDIAPAELAREADEVRRRLVAGAKSLGRVAAYDDWSAAGPAPRVWRTATASDLSRGGALTLLRTAPDSKGSAGAAPVTAVLTGMDIARGTAPSGDPSGLRADGAPVIAAGDVLVRAVAGGGGAMARVADDADAGALLGHQVHLFRPDPARLDPWFLAGFLGAEENIASASTGSTVLHVSPGRLRVPLLPLEEQRRYGEAFRRVHTLRTEAARATELAEETARLLVGGLTGGGLVPSAPPTAGSGAAAESA